MCLSVKVVHTACLNRQTWQRSRTSDCYPSKRSCRSGRAFRGAPRICLSRTGNPRSQNDIDIISQVTTAYIRQTSTRRILCAASKYSNIDNDLEDWAPGLCVHISGLPWERDPEDVSVAVRNLCRDDANIGPPVDLIIPGFGSEKRKIRDQDKKHRGFAIARFTTPEAANAAVRKFSSGAISGQALRAALLDEGAIAKWAQQRAKKGVGHAKLTGSTPEAQLKEEARQRLREHKRRNNQRQKALVRAEQDAILSRLIPPRGFVAGPSTGADALEAWEQYYSRWRDPAEARSLGAIDWSNVPPAADPAIGGRLGGSRADLLAAARTKMLELEEAQERGDRKRLQVESLLAVLRAAGLTRDGTVLVDFGSGSGNLALPLSHLLPRCTFLCLDIKSRAIDLLNERAAAANLTNIHAFVGTIQEFEEPFDACLALHVCGAATDYAMIKAVERHVPYVMSPCCIGKLHRTVHGRGLDLVNVDPAAAGTRPLRGMQVRYPRSRWMRRLVTAEEFVSLAAAADYSGHNGVSGYDANSTEGRIPRLAKAAVEADRNASAREEAGYSTHLMKLLYPQACVRNDLLIGQPAEEEDYLGRYVERPAGTAQWGDECGSSATTTV